MAYDTVRQQALLFGGYLANDLGDTWTFDGTNWTQQAVSTSPSARSGPQLAWDARIGRAVLFGGVEYRPGGPTFLDDTWVR